MPKVLPVLMIGTFYKLAVNFYNWHYVYGMLWLTPFYLCFTYGRTKIYFRIRIISKLDVLNCGTKCKVTNARGQSFIFNIS